METKILKVVRQGEAFSVQSAKAETGTIAPCWATWQGVSSPRVTSLSQQCDSLLMNIKDKRSKRFWHQK